MEPEGVIYSESCIELAATWLSSKVLSHSTLRTACEVQLTGLVISIGWKGSYAHCVLSSKLFPLCVFYLCCFCFLPDICGIFLIIYADISPMDAQ